MILEIVGDGERPTLRIDGQLTPDEAAAWLARCRPGKTPGV